LVEILGAAAQAAEVAPIITPMGGVIRYVNKKLDAIMYMDIKYKI